VTRRAAVALRLLCVVLLYALYAWTRNRHGAESADAYDAAVRHARSLVAVEDALRLPTEAALQSAVLGQKALLRACGAYYGTAHFLVTLAVLAWCVLRRPRQVDRLAGVLLVATFAGVAVFAAYPVAPPRLLPDGTVDTLAVLGGVWSYDHGVLERISDPFAALPSLHLAWATWCALALRHLGGRRWAAVGALHVLLTLVAVLLTGNHWYLDAVAGAALVLLVWRAVVRPRPDVSRPRVLTRTGSVSV
jgi:hypothetical protein